MPNATRKAQSPRRSEDTLRRILEVAEREFAVRGYAGARIQEIAEKVGIQKASLYYYFRSKEELYIAVVKDILTQLEETVETSLNTSGTRKDQAVNLTDRIIEFFAKNPNYSKIILQRITGEAQVNDADATARVDRIIQKIAGFFHDGTKEGEFKKLNSFHLLQSVIGMTIFHFAADRFSSALTGSDIFSEQAVAKRKNEVTQLLLHGILADS